MVLAGVLTAALMLSATYAWYEQITEVNKFRNAGAEKSVVLRDDFDGTGPDKHIFVENTSEKAEVYVRVKLQEYMDLTSWNDRNISGNEWQTHIPSSSPEVDDFVNPDLERYHKHFVWEMGGSTVYTPAQTGTNGMINIYDSNTTKWLSSEKEKPTPDAQVILMSEYKEMTDGQRQVFIGWVYDADGWAYWSQPLAAGEATGLLLQAVNAQDSLDGLDYFYAINVLMEAVDKSDLAMWTTPSGQPDNLGQPSIVDGKQAELGTSDAVWMLYFISDTEHRAEHTVQLISGPTKTEYVAGETFNPAGLEIEVTLDDGTDPFIVDSGFSYSPTGPLSVGTTSVTVSYCKATVVIPITVVAAE